MVLTPSIDDPRQAVRGLLRQMELGLGLVDAGGCLVQRGF